MASIDDIRESVASISDPSLRHLTGSLFEYLVRTDDQQLEELSSHLLARVLGVAHPADLAIPIRLLTEQGALEPWYLFHDRQGSEFDLTHDEIMEAKAEGGLIHPETGDLIPDFENMLATVYSSSPDLRLAKLSLLAQPSSPTGVPAAAPLTVGEMREIIDDLPDDMPIVTTDRIGGGGLVYMGRPEVVDIAPVPGAVAPDGGDVAPDALLLPYLV